MKLSICGLVMFIIINNNGHGQLINENKIIEEFYIYRVKQIDEFIERFNNEDSTLLKNYLRSNNYSEINRSTLISSLFLQEKSWNNNIDLFINEIVSKNLKLSYINNHCYADLKCLFHFKNQIHWVRLIMQIHSNKKGSKWVIRSVDSEFTTQASIIDSSKLLNPVSHATDFLGLHAALADTSNLRNYFYPDFEPDPLSYFFFHLRNGNLKLKQVNKVTYHFLQFDNWIFTINNYHKKSKNSGWLIDNLIRVSPQNKKEYMQSVLKIYSS